MIYLKLSIKNITKMKKEYAIYFLTILFCSSFYYAFNSVNTGNILVNEIPQLSLMVNQLKAISSVISFAIVFFIIYINGFILKRRTKEFALYAVLGMRRIYYSILFSLENIVIGIIAALSGSVFGILISLLLKYIFMMTFDLDLNISKLIVVDLPVLYETFKYYLLIFILVSILNIIRLNRVELIDLIHSDKKNESVVVRNTNVQYLLLLISIVGLVVISKYLVNYLEHYGMRTDNQSMMMQQIMLTLFVVSTFLFYYSFASIIVFLKKYMPTRLKKNINLFIIGEISSKINSKTKVYTVLSLCILLTMVSFSLGFILEAWANNRIEISNVYDFEVSSVYNDIYDENLNLEIDYDQALSIINEESVIAESLALNLYFENVGDFKFRKKIEFPALVIKLSDYNAVRKLKKLESIVLEDDEFSVHFEKLRISEDELLKMEIFNKGLILNADNLMFNKANFNSEALGTSLYNDYVGYTIIVNDKYCNNLKVAKSNLLINYVNITNITTEELVSKKLMNWFTTTNKDISNYYQEDYPIRINSKIVKAFNSKLSGTIIKLTGILIGSSLLIMSCTILSIQQLVNFTEGVWKYEILKKLGADERHLKNSVLKLMLINFNIPFIFGIISFIIFLVSFIVSFNTQLSALFTSNNLLIVGLLIPIMIFMIIYYTYFTVTYLISKSSVINDRRN